MKQDYAREVLGAASHRWLGFNQCKDEISWCCPKGTFSLPLPNLNVYSSMPLFFLNPSSSRSCPLQTEQQFSVLNELTLQSPGTVCIWVTSSANKTGAPDPHRLGGAGPSTGRKCSPFLWKCCWHLQRDVATLRLLVYRHITEHSLGLSNSSSKLLNVREAKRCVSASQHCRTGNEISKGTWEEAWLMLLKETGTSP